MCVRARMCVYVRVPLGSHLDEMLVVEQQLDELESTPLHCRDARGVRVLVAVTERVEGIHTLDTGGVPEVVMVRGLGWRRGWVDQDARTATGLMTTPTGLMTTPALVMAAGLMVPLAVRASRRP